MKIAAPFPVAAPACGHAWALPSPLDPRQWAVLPWMMPLCLGWPISGQVFRHPSWAQAQCRGKALVCSGYVPAGTCPLWLSRVTPPDCSCHNVSAYTEPRELDFRASDPFKAPVLAAGGPAPSEVHQDLERKSMKQPMGTDMTSCY